MHCCQRVLRHLWELGSIVPLCRRRDASPAHQEQVRQLGSTIVVNLPKLHYAQAHQHVLALQWRQLAICPALIPEMLEVVLFCALRDGSILERCETDLQ